MNETELGLSLWASPDGRPGGVAVYARNANTIFFDKDAALALMFYFAEFYDMQIELIDRESEQRSVIGGSMSNTVIEDIRDFVRRNPGLPLEDHRTLLAEIDRLRGALALYALKGLGDKESR